MSLNFGPSSAIDTDEASFSSTDSSKSSSSSNSVGNQSATSSINSSMSLSFGSTFSDSAVRSEQDSDTNNLSFGNMNTSSSEHDISEQTNSSRSTSMTSSDTLEYDPVIDLSPHPQYNPNEIIEINDTQVINELDLRNDDDDDVIHIPQHIEVIDLCTQIPQTIEEVIVIEESQVPQQNQLPAFLNPNHETPLQRRRNRAAPYTLASSSESSNTIHNRLRHHSGRRLHNPLPSSPVIPTGVSTSAVAFTSTTPMHLASSIMSQISDGSQNGTSSLGLNISCPICLDSIVGKEPVSTNCGHLFCKQCIQGSLKVTKKCPMCKKNLNGRTPYHNIWL